MSEYKTEKVFVDGLFIKDRTEKTPDFVLASYSINVEKFKKWLANNEQQANNGWLNIDIKKGKTGNKYAELNPYKPQNSPSEPQNAPVTNDSWRQAGQNLSSISNGKPIQTPEEMADDIPFR